VENFNIFDRFFDVALTGRFTFLFLFILFFSVGLIVILIIASWKLFKKAGKKGWEALVPFYNNYVLVEISGLNWWWFLLIISPNIISYTNDDLYGIASLASMFATFNCFYNIARKFKKDTGISVCAGIFSFIFMLFFAFSSKEQYYSDVKVSNNGVFNNSSNSQNNNNSSNDIKSNSENTYKYCSNCGAKLEEHYKFCDKCGNKIE